MEARKCKRAKECDIKREKENKKEREREKEQKQQSGYYSRCLKLFFRKFYCYFCDFSFVRFFDRTRKKGIVVEEEDLNF